MTNVTIDNSQLTINNFPSSSPKPPPQTTPPKTTLPKTTPEGQPASGDPSEQLIPSDPDERLILAKRLIADRCLYGVDKNPLAVEMAKLSLWLITMDKNRAFTFLDHAFKGGDSLVGVNLDQLTTWSLEGKGERRFETLSIRGQIDRMVALRRQISLLPLNSVADQHHKRLLFEEAEAVAHDLRQGGDLLIGSYFNTLKKAKQENLRIALLAAFRDGADIQPEWATEADLGPLRPFHWVLEFPEVFLAKGRSGFDAFVGNPPFVGGRRIRDTMGAGYRKILYDLYPDSKGNADYSAFFFLGGYERLQRGGTLGLIATNTIAQGDTRETGLDKIVSEAGLIYHATNNQSWPGMAAVVVSIVHIAKGITRLYCILDGKRVEYISSLLDSRKVMGNPKKLVATKNKSFQGSLLRGMGFVLTSDEAQILIEKNPQNEKVIHPYLNGKDLNSNPDQSPNRWVINFFDWPLVKAETYVEPMNVLKERVYPARMGDEKSRKTYEKIWWQFWRPRTELYRTISEMKRVLIRPRVSNTHAPVFVPNNWVYSEATVVFAFDDYSHFVVMQSSLHEHWTRKYASTLKGDIRYSPSDVFDTFPFPNLQTPIPNLQSLNQIGETYHEHRRQLMLDRQEGLTKSYNRFHNPDETAADIARLRELHLEMDQTVALAYGWADLALGHDFHQTPQGLRYTISEAARRDVLERLLALNHARYEEEVAAGLHDKKKAKGKRGSRGAGEKGSGGAGEQGSGGAGEQGSKGAKDGAQQLGLFSK